MISYIILFLLFLLQFFYFPFGNSFFEGSKVYFAELLIFVLLLLSFFSKDSFSLKQIKKPVLWSFVILFILTVYHLLFHQSSTILFGNEFRLQGTFLIWMLIVFAFVSAKQTIENKVTPFLITGVLLVQLVCTLLFIGVGADRPVGTIGEPNALAASVLFFWPFLVFPLPKKALGWIFTILGIVAALIIIFVSGSRSGIIAFGVQLACIILYQFLTLIFRSNSKKRLKLTVATIVSILILFATYITPFIGPRTEYEDRGEIWKAAVHAGLDHPIAGVGFGNAADAYHKANVELFNKLQGYHVDNAHNIFLDWFVQAGVVGVGVLLLLIGIAFKSFISTLQTRNSVLLLGLLTALSFNPASIVSLIALWWLLGQGIKKK